MKKLKTSPRDLIPCFLVSLLLRIGWAVPAAALLVLHFVLDWSAVWLYAALGGYLLIVVFWTFMLYFANRCGNIPFPDRPNRNVYSRRNADVFSGYSVRES